MLLNPYICHISASVDQILICLLFPPYFIVAIMGVDTRFEDLINRTLRMAKLRFKNYALFPGHPLVYQMVKRRQPAINISHSSATSTANTFDFFSWLEFLSWVSFCLRQSYCRIPRLAGVPTWCHTHISCAIWVG